MRKFILGASIICSALLAIAPLTQADYYGDGYNKFKEEKYDEAITILEEGLNLTPEDYKIAYLLGYCYTKKEKWNEALEPLKKAVMVKPESFEAHFLLGFAHMKMKQDGKEKPD